MHYIVVNEAAHHVNNAVGFANVGEKLVTQTLAFRCAGDETGDIDELHHRRNGFLRLRQIDQCFYAWIGDFDDADIGFDGTERIVFRRDTRFGQRIEQRGFADIRQTNNPTFKAH